MMPATINERWIAYCDNISAAANTITESLSSQLSPISESLKRFLDFEAPTRETELCLRIAEGDKLKASWGISEYAYAESKNHEVMPMPTQSMADQAQMVQDDCLKNPSKKLQ